MQQQKAVGLRHNINYLFDRGSNGQNPACFIGQLGRTYSERVVRLQGDGKPL